MIHVGYGQRHMQDTARPECIPMTQTSNYETGMCLHVMRLQEDLETVRSQSMHQRHINQCPQRTTNGVLIYGKHTESALEVIVEPCNAWRGDQQPELIFTCPFPYSGTGIYGKGETSLFPPLFLQRELGRDKQWDHFQKCDLLSVFRDSAICIGFRNAKLHISFHISLHMNGVEKIKCRLFISLLNVWWCFFAKRSDVACTCS